MSINITVHSNGHPTTSSKNPFASLESVRKADNEERRRARLEQVRQQSKELAAKVRRNFQKAKQQELCNVEKVKQAELKRWKQKHITKLQSNYQACLEDVGEAHRAAEAAEQCEIWFQEKKATQQANALLRGRQAEAKRAEENQEREKRKEYKPMKSVGVQAIVPIEKPLESKKQGTDVHADESVSSANTFSAFEQFKKGSIMKSSLPAGNDRPLIWPEFIFSDEDAAVSGKNKENIPSNNSPIKTMETLYYNPTTYTSPETLGNHVPSTTNSTRPAALKPFTQVSDYIQRRREERSQKIPPVSAHIAREQASYSSQKIVQFDEHSENTLSFPTSAALDRSILESPRKPVRKLLEQPKPLPLTSANVRPPIVPPKGKDSIASSVKHSTHGSATSVGEATSRVQYYDYNTKYRKEYDQPSSLVQRNEKVEGELNAMQEASRLERLQDEMLKARRKPSEGTDRAKVALEKLQTRKDYENLKAELDKLVRAESMVKALDTTTKKVQSETQQRQRSEIRQKRLNEAVEDLLKEKVLITCPLVREPPANVQLPSRQQQVNVAAVGGNAKADKPFGDDSNIRREQNSSDSCSTIVLGHEPNNTTRAGISLPPGTQGSDKVSKLKDLLEQINTQRQLLTEELKKEQQIEKEVKSALDVKSTHCQTDDGIKQIQQRQQQLEEQQKQLKQKEREILDLEKQLKEKMNRMKREKSQPRVPIQVETKGSATAQVQAVQEVLSTSSSESIDSGSQIPVKIVITVNDKTQKKIKKTPKKMVSEGRKRKKAVEVRDEPPEPLAEPHPKTPVKAKKVPVKTVAPPQPKPIPDAEPSPISSTTSTIYRQLPAKIDNRVGQLLNQISEKQIAEQPHLEAPKVQSKPAKIVPKHMLKKTAPPPVTSRERNLNPNLMQYIVRLLGMSRQSIDQLGVSSSTSISTPHESVVNVSDNRSGAEETPLPMDAFRIDRLRRFIDENYNFLNEIDETLKDQQLDGTMDENISRVEDIWMKTLSRKEQEIRGEKPVQPPKAPEAPKHPTEEPSPSGRTEGSLKSILKSPKKASPKVAKIITPQGHVEVINLSDRDEQEVLAKYSQLTENCSKRISELSDMIRKVREEKKKLIENSLSSSEQQESTKYMDLPVRHSGETPAALHRSKSASRGSVETSPPSAKEDPISEEINNIFTSARQIGLSKDSGIAMSRPVTSSDFRDSPDARPPNAGVPQFESSEDLSSREKQPVAFEPLLKDIPKVTSRVFSADSNSHPATAVSQAPEARELGLAKRTKPPMAITRYSPQLEEAVAAHELSTIPEVETPGASKVNISIPASERLDSSEQLLVDARDKLLDYARSIGYEGFPVYDEYVRRENLESTRYDPEKTSQSKLNELLEVTGKSDLLRYQKFPVPAPEMNITGETLKGSTLGGENSLPGAASNSSSSASLPDVVAELKRRNIIDKSFESLDDSNRSTPNSLEITAVPPVRKSPMKKKHTKKANDMTTNRTSSEVTESLERDLNTLGLRWASSMLKKNQELQLLQDHSSSSSLSLADDIRRAAAAGRKQKSNTTGDLDESQPHAGKPLNLKEFIARELMIRTQSDLNSLTNSSSPCSVLLKSLLDISHINTSTPELLTQTTDKNIQRTSTPVATKSSSSASRENGGGAARDASITLSNGLFSGESRLSSVRMSSSSGEEHKLTIPNARLDVDKYRKKGGSE
ncbi:uncharacterized protein LOC129778024 [Toxorhynchites rutilus septentrionalis]|uniref:uncharacterized protein LOC129778024 n=1 Tax=Toxorhynchites rutilus septentrionalis TaxID=329112 RepID=UPI00247920DA|nr:uncharacterized protein LOC129778024 [Toxorhynchites rutilus septentrionalis]XP_055640633.1 uncharacterized protein LOC129778024 [Toxorhynchites rutilus septentrionalis]XP_055640634.1 uncharacterized protein LOC129778024 [Toxorhynchites rutilus septentrionalis]